MVPLTKIKAIGLRKLAAIAVAVYRHGFTLLALLEAVKNKPVFIQDNYARLSYSELYGQSVAMAGYLSKKYSVGSDSKVIFACSNSVAFTKMLFAVSGLGADIVLLNFGQTGNYFTQFLQTYKADLIITDTVLAENMAGFGIPVCDCNTVGGPGDEVNMPNSIKWKRGSITILSSGSKGRPETEKRKVSVLNYLYPLADIIEKLPLQESKSVLVSVPVYHGYGLAALCLSVFMAKDIRLAGKFNTGATRELLRGGKDCCWITVPLMIIKVYDCGKENLINVKSIVSGGDVLPPGLVNAIHATTTVKIYNMYGTSETGVCTIATDADLKQYPETIGKAIKGIKTKIAYATGNHLITGVAGMLSVKCGWSADDKKNAYIATGDLVFRNKEGYYFYKGRQDDMIVTGGENVYPIELESIIYEYQSIKWVKAKGITMENGTVRIHIDVVVHADIMFCEKNLLKWIQDKVPAYMMPQTVTVLDKPVGVKLM